MYMYIYLKSWIKDISPILYFKTRNLVLREIYITLGLEPVPANLKPTVTYCLAVCQLGKSCSPQRVGSHCTSKSRFSGGFVWDELFQNSEALHDVIFFQRYLFLLLVGREVNYFNPTRKWDDSKLGFTPCEICFC